VTYVFPFAIVALMVCASAVYFFVGDWRHGVFWLAASVINFIVTI
jgi:hypothetical protein